MLLVFAADPELLLMAANVHSSLMTVLPPCPGQVLGVII